MIFHSYFSSQSKTFSNCHNWTRNDPKPCRVSVRRVIHIYIQRVTKLLWTGSLLGLEGWRRHCAVSLCDYHWLWGEESVLVCGGGWGRIPLFKHFAPVRPPNATRVHTGYLASAHHLGADCDCAPMTIPPGWPDPIPAKTDIATASAARTLSPLMVGPGLEAEAGGDGPCWITAAGEPMGSVEVSLEVSSPPAARDRERNIHP